jgi:imidazolonepropionase-like amidohydrolase
VLRHSTPLTALAVGIGSLVFSPVQPPAHSKAPEHVAIRAAQLVDVQAGVLRKDVVVLVDGDRISAIKSGPAIPAGYTAVDLGTATLLPGLIDCHTHLMMRLGQNETYAQHLLTKSQADRALEGAANARQTLHAGFTTVRDVENEGSGYADVALRDAIGQGLVEGPTRFQRCGFDRTWGGP